jgi:capsid portal protein
MNPSDFGTIVKTIKSIFIIQNKLGQTITLEQIRKNNLISIASKGKVLISFGQKDKFIEQNKFVRIIDTKKYYFINNKEIVKVDLLKTKFIGILKPSKDLENKIITLDIETYIENGDLIPYLISFYDGIKCYNF